MDFKNSFRYNQIKELEDKISEFCSLLENYDKFSSPGAGDKYNEFIEQFGKLKYQIKFLISPKQEPWNSLILGYLDNLHLYSDKNSIEKRKTTVIELSSLAQFFLNAELDILQEELRSTNVSESMKQSIHEKYFGMFKSRKNINN